MTLRCRISIPNAATDWGEVAALIAEYFRSQFVIPLAMKTPWSPEEFRFDGDEVGWSTECIVGDARYNLSLTTNGRADGSPPSSIMWTLTADARMLTPSPSNSRRNTIFRAVFLATFACAAGLGWSIGGRFFAVIGGVIGVPLGIVLAILFTNRAIPPPKLTEPLGATEFYLHVKRLVSAQPYQVERRRRPK